MMAMIAKCRHWSDDDNIGIALVASKGLECPRIEECTEQLEKSGVKHGN